MIGFWLKIKFWTKLALAGLIFLYMVVFISKNSEQPDVAFWYWYNRKVTASPLVMGLWTSLAGVVITLLVQTTSRTVRQLRRYREREKL